MPKQNVEMLAFNRGIISPLALGRVDLERTALSAEIQTNWMPRVLGSMMLRPGLEYRWETNDSDVAKLIPFVFSTDETALVEVTGSSMRVWDGDSLVTRPSVSSTITNGEFTSNLNGWTDADETGTVSEYEFAALLGGRMKLTGNGTNQAARYQAVSTSSAGTEHALRIEILRGPVELKVGTSAGDDSYISATLRTGTHSLTFTPSGTFYIQFSSSLKRSVLVESVAVESAGIMELPSPWAEDDLNYLRWDQSGDVIFVACDRYQQRRIERRSATSWSIVRYQPEDGPFRIVNTSPITLTPSALSGDITVTASEDLFTNGHIGALFRLTSAGQEVQESISSDDTFTSSIRVTGIGNSRAFSVSVSGFSGGTVVTLQRSPGEPGSWTDVEDYTANTSKQYNDELDNQIIYYRLGIKSGEYGSGTVTVSLSFAGGSASGVVRVNYIVDGTEVGASVLSDLGSDTATSDWEEGAWSDLRGWPSAVALYEGRLWWSGGDYMWGSESDAYEDFDDQTEGDAGPISRAIGSGPVDVINWLLPLQRLLVGTEGSEKSARSNSLDEPLTPTNFNLKNISTQGSARVPAVVVDSKGLFVQRSGLRVYEMDFKASTYDYGSMDMTTLAPKVCSPGVKWLAVQRQPDTRVHCVLNDGAVAILIYDPVENVVCWVRLETDGEVEDAVVLPGDNEDQVYYVVKRTINGATKRYVERWAKEDDCQGGTLNRQADSFVVYPGSSLDHLEGQTVVMWGGGRDLGTATVSGGSVSLPSGVTEAVVGLPYTAQYKSTKLAYGAAMGSSLMQRKRINALALMLANTHYQGLQYGSSFDLLDDLPGMSQGAAITDDTVWEGFDEESFTFNDTWDTDSRLCLQASAPRPCTVLAAIMSMDTNDKA
ncbi:hypothetical protein RE428_31800 [Marinobacter nanhaiticus D15-8W]|uniref:Uncharacterized protein n=1 Tax=Marinobacter nanhaiticus D15-8W TaxID=626887 RepID=N6X722_9GAMM|nr:hypothetical protein [Marinobacter nanhaiticus]ENO16938.2 hypothetical protein J057_01665 [Marinobacter nanhaiticus D15-8W]BES72162.1 hypothetical protein RE428_31800 [Marinobacter nanhaiticus D15-8W]